MPDNEPRTRALGALLGRPGRGQAVVAVLLALLGFAAAVQVRVVDSDSAYTGARRDDLVELLQTLSAAQDRAEAQLAELEDTRLALQASSDQRQTALEEAQVQLDALQLLSGQVAATGPGVRITVADADGTVGAATLLNAVEELRDAGAEAIEINNVARVVAQTWFGDGRPSAGAALVVDERTVTAPYVIEAIADPATLAEAVTFPGGLTDEVEALGGTVTVAQAEALQVESLAPERTTEYAEPTT